MRPFRILLMSVLLLSAIACSDEEEIVPAPAPPVPTSADTVINGVDQITGFHNIVRFEQDGVENHQLKGQFLDFLNDGRVQVHGRNYLYEGDWSYLENKEYIRINIPGDEIQAAAVSSPEWAIVQGRPGVLTLRSDANGTVKKLELMPRRKYSTKVN